VIPVLCSFHYFRNTSMAELQAEYGNRLDVFVDSGAFSALNAGASITVEDYCAWLRDNAESVNFAAALDVIGDYKATRANADAMQSAVGAVCKVLPTFHVGSPWSELESLCKEYDFVALGGAVAVSRRLKAMTQWLVQAMRISQEHGVVNHGFGLTRDPFPGLLPFYSVDSSYWKYGKMGGVLQLWDVERSAHVKVQSGKRLSVDDARLVSRYGFDLARFQTPGFGIVNKTQDGAQAQAEYRYMGLAGAWSVLLWQEHLRSVKTAVRAPQGVFGDGLKMYLACSPSQDLPYIAEAYDRVQGVAA
jgi:hypothetical protein